MNPVVDVRQAVDRDDIAAWMRGLWGDTTMVVHDQLYDMSALPALVASRDDKLFGVLTYVIDAGEMEIVSCDANPPGRGVGRALVNAAVSLARCHALKRIWCTTTNDNLPALGFWQALGFRLIQLRPGAVARARELKPSIPAHGHLGLPIHDELDLELLLEIAP